MNTGQVRRAVGAGVGAAIWAAALGWCGGCVPAEPTEARDLLVGTWTSRKIVPPGPIFGLGGTVAEVTLRFDREGVAHATQTLGPAGERRTVRTHGPYQVTEGQLLSGRAARGKFTCADIFSQSVGGFEVVDRDRLVLDLADMNAGKCEYKRGW